MKFSLTISELSSSQASILKWISASNIEAGRTCYIYRCEKCNPRFPNIVCRNSNDCVSSDVLASVEREKDRAAATEKAAGLSQGSVKTTVAASIGESHHGLERAQNGFITVASRDGFSLGSNGQTVIEGRNTETRGGGDAAGGMSTNQ